MPPVWRQAATDWRRPDGGVGGLVQLMGANQRRELQDIAVPSLPLIPALIRCDRWGVKTRRAPPQVLVRNARTHLLERPAAALRELCAAAGARPLPAFGGALYCLDQLTLV